MVYQKVFGALKSMNNNASDVFGRIKVGVQKYAPDILEHGTAIASMIPGAHQPFAAAANMGIRALRGKINEVPNKEAAEKLSSAVNDNNPVIGVDGGGNVLYKGDREGGNKIMPNFAETLPVAVKHFQNTIRTREAEAKAFRKGNIFKKYRKIKTKK